MSILLCPNYTDSVTSIRSGEILRLRERYGERDLDLDGLREMNRSDANDAGVRERDLELLGLLLRFC
jgi:hypothetical protein